jgi:hypothetical protein
VSPGSNPWGHNKRIYPFTPQPSLSSLIHQHLLHLEPVVTFLLPSFHLSFAPWISKDPNMKKAKDWMEITLPRTLY